jgi:hypothetical protein
LIGVNVNGYDARKLKEVMAKEKMTWRSFVDQGAIIGQWNLPGTPTFYVIDHTDVIRHKWVGSPADYKLGGLPDEKVIDAALEKLIQEAETQRKQDERRQFQAQELITALPGTWIFKPGETPRIFPAPRPRSSCKSTKPR